jgi:hypothetical protein
VKRHGISVVLGVAVAIALAAWGLRGSLLEKRRLSALLSYRNGLVTGEVARVEELLRRSPPRTIADVTKIVGTAPSMCDDKNEPGPLDDPRAEKCPKGSACHEAFYMAYWYVRRHIESPDTRVWFDRKLEPDNSGSKVRIHVTGCDPGDVVLEIDKLEPARFSIGEW